MLPPPAPPPSAHPPFIPPPSPFPPLDPSSAPPPQNCRGGWGGWGMGGPVPMSDTPSPPPRPLFVAGAGLPPLPLKGPFVEFPALGGPELAKLGGAGGGLLFPPAPPFLYSPSPPFCPEPPLLQVGAGLRWGAG